MNHINEIKQLLKEGESNTLEFKSNLNKEAIAKVLCSFMNAEGGRLIVGVDESGTINGVDISQDKIDDLRLYLTRSIIPNTPIDLSVVNVKEDKKILILKVQEGSKQPYIYDGGIYFRNGERTQKATSSEVSKLIHQRQEDEQHWERQLNLGVDWEDLDEDMIVRTFSDARESQRLGYESSDVGTLLQEFGLMSNMAFTNACTLLFAKKAHQFIPQVRVRITEYPSSKTGDTYLNDEFLEGNLFTIVNKLQKHIDQLGSRSLFVENDWQRKDFSFPPKALREGLLNAIVHRDYAKYNSHMTVSIYPDQLIIANSGTLPEELGGKASLKRLHRSFPNNPDIAHIFFLRGYIEKLGRGTNKIVEECKLAGLKAPIWKDTGSEVILTFHGPKLNASSSTDAPKVNLDALSQGKIDALSDALSDALDKSVSSKVLSRLHKTIQLLYTANSLTLADLMNSLSVSRATMQRDMLYLHSIELTTYKGSDKFREYLLNDALRSKIDALK